MVGLRCEQQRVVRVSWAYSGRLELKHFMLDSTNADQSHRDEWVMGRIASPLEATKTLASS